MRSRIGGSIFVNKIRVGDIGSLKVCGWRVVLQETGITTVFDVRHARLDIRCGTSVYTLAVRL